MKSTKMAVMFVALLCFLSVSATASAMSSANYKIDWLVPLTGAGGGEAGSTNYKANVTLGQSVIGALQSTNYQIGLGYWHNIQPEQPGHNEGHIYLPLVLRN